MRTPRTILVTGTSGFIGSNLAEHLMSVGDSVIGIDNRPGRYTTLQCDLVTDFAACARSIQTHSPDAVVHLAANADTRSPWTSDLTRINVDVPLELAELAGTCGATFIYASSASVYGNAAHGTILQEDDAWKRDVCTGPLNAYAMSKMAVDRAMLGQTHSGRWVGLRFTNVFGLGDEVKALMRPASSAIYEAIVTGKCATVFAGTTDACRDYVPVLSLARTVEAIISTRTLDSGVYNLSSGAPVSFGDIVDWARLDAGGELVGRVIEVPHPFPDEYQYWNVASPKRLISSLRGVAMISLASIRSAMCDQFRRPEAS